MVLSGPQDLHRGLGDVVPSLRGQNIAIPFRDRFLLVEIGYGVSAQSPDETLGHGLYELGIIGFCHRVPSQGTGPGSTAYYRNPAERARRLAVEAVGETQAALLPAAEL